MMTSLPDTALVPFSKLVDITQLSSHEYGANLPPDWCIGSVPNGGVCASIILATATKHFKTTHASLSPQQVHPITFHATFTIKTQAGPAKIVVTDTKIGRGYSVVHLSLVQEEMKCINAYITMTNMLFETGPTLPTRSPILPTYLQGESTVGKLLSQEGVKGWEERYIPYPKFRRAASKIRFFSPIEKDNIQGDAEHYVCLENGENLTNSSLGFVTDMFTGWVDGTKSSSLKQHKEEQDRKKSGQEKVMDSPVAKYWFPTLTLTIDFKTALPEEGVPWLYSRVNSRQMSNGRMDLEIVVMDVDGKLVAISNHVALLVDAKRNLKTRGKRDAKI